MRGDLRRENARIYSEMYDEGLDPFRGSWRSVTVMVLCFLAAVASMMLAFYLVFAAPVAIVEDVLRHRFDNFRL